MGRLDERLRERGIDPTAPVPVANYVGGANRQPAVSGGTHSGA